MLDEETLRIRVYVHEIDFQIGKLLSHSLTALASFLARRTKRLQKPLQLAKHLHGIAVPVHLRVKAKTTPDESSPSEPLPSRHRSALQTAKLSTAPSRRTKSETQHQIHPHSPHSSQKPTVAQGPVLRERGQRRCARHVPGEAIAHAPAAARPRTRRARCRRSRGAP